MERRRFYVRCDWDPEAKIWFVAASNVPGLAAEADTQQAMTMRLRRVVPELLCLSDAAVPEDGMPLELFYRHVERVRLEALPI